MKWAILLVTLFAITLLIPSIVFAQETTSTTNEAEESPGILPDNPFYGLKVFVEKLQLTLTFNEKARIKLRLKLAERRLSEAEQMALRNKTQVVEQLIERYREHVEEAEQERERLRLRNITVEDVDEWMNRTTNKHIYVLQRVLERAPEQAKPGLQNALENAERNRDRIRDRLLERIRNITTTTTTVLEIEETTTTTQGQRQGNQSQREGP